MSAPNYDFKFFSISTIFNTIEIPRTQTLQKKASKCKELKVSSNPLLVGPKKPGLI